jgi:DNA polymerase I
MSIIPTSRSNCVALSTKLDRFDNVFVCDFEFRFDKRDLPVPVCASIIEMHSGEELILDRAQMLALRRAPFDIGGHSLFVAYNAVAEMLCFLQLGWPLPQHVIDPFVLTAALTNGSRLWPHRKFRPGLLTALQLFGLEGIESEEKKAMIDLILSREAYTPKEWALISTYCRSDVVATCALLLAQIDQIDMRSALHWGRFVKAVARQEQLGLPVDMVELERLTSNWTALKLDAIRRYQVEPFFDDVHFVEQRFEDFISYQGWDLDWPRTPTGKLETKQATIARQAEQHPELQALAHVRSALTDLRLSHLVNSIGSDGYARCALRPFHTITGRSQPHARERSFLPALPSWLHGLLKPPPGFALLELDWATQEVGIMAR